MSPVQPLPLVISIQSQVAFGHVGNSAAAFPMRACGIEVVEVPTTLLSNHPHYPTTRGRVLATDLVDDLFTGLIERGLHKRASVVLSGFLGRAKTAEATAMFVRRAKAENPNLVYACDPVMGDVDLGFFADQPLRNAFIQDLVPLADVILPNAFELSALSGLEISGKEDVIHARKALRCPAIVATSITNPYPDRLATVIATEGRCISLDVQRLPLRPAGTGDLLSGLTVARLALGHDLESAVTNAVAGVNAVLQHTSTHVWAEMPITALLHSILEAEACNVMAVT